MLAAANREALLANGVVVYLKSAVTDLWQRTRYDRSRPLLQTADPRAKIKELYEQRDPLYLQAADIVIPTAGKASTTWCSSCGRNWGAARKTTPHSRRPPLCIIARCKH